MVDLPLQAIEERAGFQPVHLHMMKLKRDLKQEA